MRGRRAGGPIPGGKKRKKTANGKHANDDDDEPRIRFSEMQQQ